MNNPSKKKNKYAEEIDEDFFYGDDLRSRSENKSEGDGRFLGRYISDKKINILLFFLMLAILILFGRSIQLQIVQGSYYKQMAEVNRCREKTLLASRGLIYDANYKKLTLNEPIFDAYVLPRDLSLNSNRRQEQIKLISSFLNLDETAVQDILAKYPDTYKYYVTLKENIDYEEALDLKIKSADVTGLYIETRNQREYLSSVDFSHILGYMGKITEEELAANRDESYLLNDYIGKTGLELTYEKILRGKYGKEKVEVDVMGQENKVINSEPPISGKNLVISIDSEVQQKIREILVNYLKKINKKRASAILLNPQNGEIIAMVSLPDFDDNLFAKGISTKDYKLLIDNQDKPLFDRSIKGEYPSGSTIKPVIAAGALQDKIITDKTSFLSTGGLWLYDRWFFPDWSASGHGLTNIYKAIAWSVNTYFYIVGGGYKDFNGLGVDGLIKYYKLFGLNAKTGIDLAGESTGFVPDPAWKLKNKNEEWFIGDTYHMAIGQGDLLVTPLQVANYTAFFANGGILYQPHLVREIFSNEGDKEIIEPKIINKDFIDQNNIDIVKKAMRQTVTLGSAHYLNNLNITVAGKTGTAQWHTEKANHAWFTGFAPYDNPEVAITVLVEEGGEGSAVSVPITYDMLNWYFNVYKKQRSLAN
jgi:penicillin-binding protein 2